MRLKVDLGFIRGVVASKRRLAAALVVVSTLTIAGLVSFVITQGLNPVRFVSAQTPPVGPTPWYWPLLQEEEDKPRPSGTIGGITVGAAAAPFEVCTGTEAVEVDPRAIPLGGLDPRPSYLPAGTEPSQMAPVAVECGGVLAWTQQEWFVPYDPESGRYGGYLIIYRAREKSVALDYAADRLRETTVGSKRAILVEPLTADGFGNSAVVLYEPFGITVIHADGITTAELIKIAESLGD